jgi:predicted  nucleic acid-binding Zn-ribbon protein
MWQRWTNFLEFSAMTISVVCPSCSSQFNAPDEAAGKTGHCPKCGSPILIPVPSRPPATQRQKDYARELGIDFAPDIDRRAISRLIDDAIAKRDCERIDRLNEIESREAIVAEGLRLRDATTDEMMNELCERGLAAVLITMNRADVTDFGELNGVTSSWCYTERNMSRQDVDYVLLTAGMTVMHNAERGRTKGA